MRELLNKPIRLKDFLNPQYEALRRRFYNEHRKTYTKLLKSAKKNPDVFRLQLMAMVDAAMSYATEIERNRSIAITNKLYGELFQRIITMLKDVPAGMAFERVTTRKDRA